MAWTTDKEKLMFDLIAERHSVEGNLGDAKKWNLIRSWRDILSKTILPEQKQLILNDLINDKIVYIDKEILSTANTDTTLKSEKTKLISSQEIVS